MLFLRSNINNITKQLFLKNNHKTNSLQRLYTSSFCLYFSTSKFESYKDVPINKSQYETSFMRSSGPGGQSVNTTNSKAEVRVNIESC